MPSQVVLVGQSGGGLASLAYGSLGKPNIKGIVNFAGGLRNSGVRWEFDMADAFKDYAKTTKAESIWFYTENDQTFPTGDVQRAFKKYMENGGQADLRLLSAFKKDGHSLFSHPDGIAIWREPTEMFLKRVGIRIPEKERDTKPQPLPDT